MDLRPILNFLITSISHFPSEQLFTNFTSAQMLIQHMTDAYTCEDHTAYGVRGRLQSTKISYLNILSNDKIYIHKFDDKTQKNECAFLHLWRVTHEMKFNTYSSYQLRRYYLVNYSPLMK